MKNIFFFFKKKRKRIPYPYPFCCKRYCAVSFFCCCLRSIFFLLFVLYISSGGYPKRYYPKRYYPKRYYPTRYYPKRYYFKRYYPILFTLYPLPLTLKKQGVLLGTGYSILGYRVLEYWKVESERSKVLYFILVFFERKPKEDKDKNN